METTKGNITQGINWNMATNLQLRQECKSLEDEFGTLQDTLRQIVERIDEINGRLNELSYEYITIKEILDKREGKGIGEGTPV